MDNVDSSGNHCTMPVYPFPRCWSEVERAQKGDGRWWNVPCGTPPVQEDASPTLGKIGQEEEVRRHVDVVVDGAETMGDGSDFVLVMTDEWIDAFNTRQRGKRVRAYGGNRSASAKRRGKTRRKSQQGP